MDLKGPMDFLMNVNDIGIARHIVAVPGVWPFVDLEYMGKAERQASLDAWASRQGPEDVTRIREAVPDAHLVVRVNPLHEASRAEIDDVIARGADAVMLPMFHARADLERFQELVAGRAVAFPLFETAASVAGIPEIVPGLGLERLHIGLNDLHLDLGQSFLFQPLAEGHLEEPTAALREIGVPFGIGGIARAREGIVSPDYLLGEHVRLGSSIAILSRTFHRNAESLEAFLAETDFVEEVRRLREIHDRFLAADAEALARNRVETADRVADVVRLIAQRGAS